MALMDCDVVMVHGITCPECGGWQIPRVEQINFPEGATAGQVQSEKLATYVCECCGAELNDVAINRAARLDAATIQEALDLLDSGDPDAFYDAAQLLGYRPQVWDSELWWWVPLDPAQAPPRPARVGVQFSAFVSPFVQLGEIAAQAIRARGDTEADHTLANRYLAIPHKHIAAVRSEDHILRPV